jgi:hypothetical protein
VFFGTISATETLPDVQLLVAGSNPSGLVELNVHVLARATIANRWMAPPAAGSFAGVAVNRLTVGVRTCRVTFGLVAATIGPTDGDPWTAGGPWTAAVSAAKTGLALTGTGPGVEPPGSTNASASSNPAIAAASASRVAQTRRGLRARPAASRRAGAVSVAVVVPRAGCIVNLICAEVRSDLMAP